MKKASILILVIALLAIFQWTYAQKILTKSPVIGILAHPENPTQFDPVYPNRQYIAASYVKWVESSGGRVVPIPFNISESEARVLFRKINGLLLPGGNVVYPETGRMLIELALKINQEGIYFPVWGTCLGFEWLGQYFGHEDILKRNNANDIALHLDFVPTANDTLLIQSMPKQIYDYLAEPKLRTTLNNHSWGILPEDFQRYLSNDFTLISTNYDLDGLKFVSTMEHRKYPIYGVQWHPEKNNFEFGMNKDGLPYHSTEHSYESVLVAQHFSNFFVDQCRRNDHHFDDWMELQKEIIYNYPKFRAGPSFVEKYWFDAW